VLFFVDDGLFFAVSEKTKEKNKKKHKKKKNVLSFFVVCEI